MAIRIFYFLKGFDRFEETEITMYLEIFWSLQRDTKLCISKDKLYYSSRLNKSKTKTSNKIKHSFMTQLILGKFREENNEQLFNNLCIYFTFKKG